jgi:hypothetical protein
VLQDRKPRHQARRQRRLSRTIVVNLAEAPFEKGPIDRPRELGEWMAHVDDLVEPRLEKIALPALPTLSRSHANRPPPRPQSEVNHAPARRSICKKTNAQDIKTGKYEYLKTKQNNV